jgi:hypothetical protein
MLPLKKFVILAEKYLHILSEISLSNFSKSHFVIEKFLVCSYIYIYMLCEATYRSVVEIHTRVKLVVLLNEVIS